MMLAESHRGTELEEQIAGIIAEWKANTQADLGRDADEVLEEFFE